MLYIISIWANHLLTYLSLPHTDMFLTEKTIVLITDSISSQNRQYQYFSALVLITVYVLH